MIWFYTKDKGKRTTELGIKSTKGKISFRDNYKEKPSKETFILGRGAVVKVNSTCEIN